MQVQNAATKPRKRREEQIKPTKLTKQKLATKRGNKPQAPLASEQKCPAQAVWWEYQRFFPLRWDMDQVYVSSLMVVSQEMESDVYVLGSGV